MATLLDNSNHKALTTLARLKSMLEINSDSKDTKLTILINQATGIVEKYLGRNLLRQTYTNEEYDGKGTKSLVLKQFPVISVSSFEYNEASDNSDNWTAYNTADYWFDSYGEITMRTSILMERVQKYRATYVAGYLIDFSNENDPSSHTLPQDLEFACMKIVSKLSNEIKGQGIKRTKIGDQEIEYFDTQSSSGGVGVILNDPELKSLLDPFKKINL